MRILLENVTLLEGKGFVAISDGIFESVGEACPAGKFDRIIDCRGGLLIPGFYNTHCHAAMSLFRGYGDDLPLSRWLNERIFPAEDKLDAEMVYWASLAACAEMIRGGVVSFSDMYMFEEQTAKAVLESGMKANLARGLVSFDENVDMSSDRRFLEGISLKREYEGAGDGRLKIDMSLHAEYTNVLPACRYVADYCREQGLRIQIHLSETLGEHERCIEKYGMTPARFFDSAGVFDSPTVAAHCVHVSEEDMNLLAERSVFVSHNPSSNLKLGSGIMPYSKMKEKGIHIALGTDGAASNNNLSILKELQLAALLHKGTELDATAALASDIIESATRTGALAQGRENCGLIAPGYRADAVLFDLDTIHTLPVYDPASALVYAADATNVKLTICDGRILYENGEYKSIDIERVKYKIREIADRHYR